MDFRFQINLGGIIDVLSNHLYSGPEVYVRELLQNCVDAIRARSHVEPEHVGQVLIDVPKAVPGEAPSLTFEDDGVGLTEEEIHLFLATIGQTSKRGGLLERWGDFIGQFGIGLLSCFVVSEEIVVVTRSVKEGARTLEWRGRADGTYSITALEEEMEPGTRVRLTCKPGSEEYFAPPRVRQLARHYGGLLPYPVRFTSNGSTVLVNGDLPPWREEHLDAGLEREAYLEYGRKTFKTEFMDYVPLRSAVGDVQGAAFVLPYSPSLATKRTHRVYLKNMLLSESAEGLLPEWAFFVKCVVNANDLRPTASRESFYEDEALFATRDALGSCLRQYLMRLASEDPPRLRRLIELHYLSIKALAVDDDEFYQLFIDWLPFETNLGTMSLGEYRKRNQTVRYVTDRDQFRQIASVAAAQQLCVINAAYVYDSDLLRKLYDLYPGTMIESVDATKLTHAFEFLTLDEQEQTADFMASAEETLRPFNCSVEMRRFSPAVLPALYNATVGENFRRSVEASKEVADPLWSSLLDNFARATAGDDGAHLCFNFDNRLIRKMVLLKDETLLRLSVQMLYVQALLLGHRPLSEKEMRLLNEGLIGLIEWGVDVEGGWIQ